MKEWANIKGYKKYEITRNGVIRNKRSKRILRLKLNHNGYYRIGLYNEKSKQNFKFVHVLVLESFKGLRPDGMECNHKDGVKTNNNLNNLEWVTKSFNIQHAIRTGLKPAAKGDDHGISKIKEKDVLKIRHMYRSGKYYQYQIAEKFSVKQSTISNLLSGKTWSHIGE